MGGIVNIQGVNTPTMFLVHRPAIAPPVIVQQPPTVATAPVTLEIEATGAAPLAYQWQFTDGSVDFYNIPGATATAFYLADAGPEGGYVRCVVSNAGGAVNSTDCAVSN